MNMDLVGATTYGSGFEISTLLFTFLMAAIVAAWCWAVGPKRRFKMAGAWALVVAVSTALVLSGAGEKRPFPVLPLFFLSVFGAAVALALSAWGKDLSKRLPLVALVGFQAFRFPLELILHDWAHGARPGLIPTTMSWSGPNGSNFDIVSGLAAVVAATVVAVRPKLGRQAAWAFNVVGGVLLLNVIRVVVRSSPLPIAWDLAAMGEPPLTLALHLPYVWIGPIAVGSALAGHLILTRRLCQ